MTVQDWASKTPSEIWADGQRVQKPDIVQLFDELDTHIDDEISEVIGDRTLAAGGWAYVRYNQDGYVQSGRLVDGTTIGETSVGAVGDFETIAKAGTRTGRAVNQVALHIDEQVQVFVSNGPWPTTYVSGDSGEIIVRCEHPYDDFAKDQTRKYRTSRVGSSLGAVHRLHLEILMAQSGGVGIIDSGVNPIPPWRDEVCERARMFDSSNYDGLPRGPRVLHKNPAATNKDVVADDLQFAKHVIAYGSDHAGSGAASQTPMESFAAAMIGQHMHYEDIVLVCVVGTGSTASIDFLPGAPDTEHMQTAKKAITAAQAIVTAFNANKSGTWELHVGLQVNQGEEDNATSVPEATYMANWIAIRDEIEAATGAAGGTFHKMIFHHCMQRPASVTSMATIAQAKLVKQDEAESVQYYGLKPGFSNPHFFPATYLPLGSAGAYMRAQLIADGTYRTPHVADGDAILTSATTTVCTITGGNGTFQFDTDSFANRSDGNYGVTMRDDSGALAVTSVELTDVNEITITHASTTIGDNPVVEFGLDGAGNHYPSSDFPRVNIRDTSSWPCICSGQIISGWMMPHETAVTV